jgi:hypothetical protein
MAHRLQKPGQEALTLAPADQGSPATDRLLGIRAQAIPQHRKRKAVLLLVQNADSRRRA